MTTTAAPETGRAPVGSLLRRVLRRPLGLLSFTVVAVIAVLAVIGRSITPYDPNRANLHLVLAPPSTEHLFGADSAGRDVLSRLLAATQVSIAAALVGLVTALVIGVAAGLIAGYYHGWFDSVASWLTSLIMALPGIVVLLAARSVLGPNVWYAMLVFGVLVSPFYYRLVYAAVNAVRGELYVDAARVTGLSDVHIIGRHILSVVRAPVIIQSAIIAGLAIAIQSGLEFLGLGDMSVPTWGSMLNEAFRNIFRAPILMVWPATAIAITSIALTLLANVMRDELERIVPAGRRRQKASTNAISAEEGNGSAAPAREGALETPADEQVIVHPDDAATADGPKDPALVIRNLTVGYHRPDGTTTEVIHGVSLDVRRGEVHGLVGESGSGKTQTAFSVLGLLSPGGRVTGGQITYETVHLANASERVFSSVRGIRIGYIPQEPMSNLDPSFTIGSQLVEPLRAQGMGKEAATRKALDLLERVGIPEPRRTFDAYPFQISGGMAQRVLIAGAVSMDPDLVVADEPTTALDVSLQAEVLDLLRDLQHERHMAMLLVTHNFGVVADLCDRVTVMSGGRFVEQGPVRSIFRHAEHPYTQALLGAILDEGHARAPLQIGGRS